MTPMTEVERECRNTWEDAAWELAWRENRRWTSFANSRKRFRYVPAEPRGPSENPDPEA